MGKNRRMFPGSHHVVPSLLDNVNLVDEDFFRHRNHHSETSWITFGCNFTFIMTVFYLFISNLHSYFQIYNRCYNCVGPLVIILFVPFFYYRRKNSFTDTDFAKFFENGGSKYGRNYKSPEDETAYKRQCLENGTFEQKLIVQMYRLNHRMFIVSPYYCALPDIYNLRKYVRQWFIYHSFTSLIYIATLIIIFINHYDYPYFWAFPSIYRWIVMSFNYYVLDMDVNFYALSNMTYYGFRLSLKQPLCELPVSVTHDFYTALFYITLLCATVLICSDVVLSAFFAYTLQGQYTYISLQLAYSKIENSVDELASFVQDYLGVDFVSFIIIISHGSSSFKLYDTMFYYWKVFENYHVRIINPCFKELIPKYNPRNYQGRVRRVRYG